MTNFYGLFQRAEEQILLVQNFKNQQKKKNKKKREENKLRLRPVYPERSKHSVNKPNPLVSQKPELLQLTKGARKRDWVT